jgi:hypothetical protein
VRESDAGRNAIDPPETIGESIAFLNPQASLSFSRQKKAHKRKTLTNKTESRLEAWEGTLTSGNRSGQRSGSCAAIRI